MKKSYLVILFIALMSFVFVGCGNEKEINLNNNTINNNKIDVEDNDNDDDTNTNIKLYSDNTKIVYDFSGVYSMVFYHDGTNITGQEYYFNYNTKTMAAAAVASIKSTYEDGDNIESVKQDGKYVIVRFTAAEYQDLTLEEVKTTYTYLKEIQENN